MFRSARWLVALLVLTVSMPLSAALRLRNVATGLSSPVLVTHASDYRLFILEQVGTIRVMPLGARTPLSTPFLDIRSRVLSGGERGLLGLAFHPGYQSNRRFFVYYTRQTDGAIVLAEYQVPAGTPNVASTSERVILTIAHPHNNHNGGMIAFGSDGYLYIATGDGGLGNDPDNRAQNPDDLLGKLLRIDVDGAQPYASPSSNPFFGSTPGRDEIFAYGLRNPWRFSIDRATGSILLGDVGQGAWEEVDRITLGGNYGWRVLEGTHCTGIDPTLCSGSYIAPILEYGHTGGRCSITGGYAYRGNAGALAAGLYVFADYCTGEIFSSALTSSSFSVLRDLSVNVSSFGEDATGELYVVSNGGTVMRIVTPAKADFAGGDARDDLVWRNRRTGDTAIWQMGSNGQVANVHPIHSSAGTVWTLAATADFNGDGDTDLAWRNSGGSNALWLMSGATVLNSVPLPAAASTWTLAAAADMNGDGRPDLIWRNGSTGGNAIWLMDGAAFLDSVALPAVSDSNWQIEAADDFDGDGWHDLVWRNYATGANAVWKMNGTSYVSSLTLPGVTNVNWRLEGSGDLDADGDPDLLWRNYTPGQQGANACWLMNGTSYVTSLVLPSVSDLDYEIAGPR